MLSYPLQADPSGPGCARPGDEPALDDRRSGEVVLRNGSGRNEACLVSSAPPRAGEEWRVWVDVAAHPGARSSLVWVSESGLAGRATPHGELLVELGRASLFRSTVVSGGGIDAHVFALPPGLAGRSFSLQAAILDGSGPSLTNAIDVVVGP